MARTTLAEAKAELIGLLAVAGNPTVAGVTTVFDHLPLGGGLVAPVSVCVYTAGITAEHWRLAVAVYVTATVDAKAAQDRLDAVVVGIDGKMTSGFGPSNWDYEYPTPEAPYLVATNVFEVGREDW